MHKYMHLFGTGMHDTRHPGRARSGESMRVETFGYSGVSGSTGEIEGKKTFSLPDLVPGACLNNK